MAPRTALNGLAPRLRAMAEGAAPEAPLLRMELDKDNWQAVPDKDRLTVSVPPEAILLLES